MVKFNVYFMSSNYLKYFSNRQINKIYTIYLVTPFWKFFKSLIFKKFGPYTNPLTISLTYSNVHSLDRYTSPTAYEGNFYIPTILQGLNILYVKPVNILHIPNPKQTYNLFAYYLFTLMLSFYPVSLKFLNSYYTYLLVQPETNLYILQSKFFFKVKSY